MEKDICTNSDREVFELEISEDEKIYASDLFVGFFWINLLNFTTLQGFPYIWIEDICYVLNYDSYDENHFFKIDLNTRKITPLHLSYPISGLQNISDMILDDSGILCVCNKTESSGQHVVHRFPLK
jgi:hypothetical protein